MWIVRSSWNCGAKDNASPKNPFPTNLPMRSRWMPSLPQSKGGKCFQSLASKAGRTRSFWTPPTAACRREKVKQCRCSQTTWEGSPLFASACPQAQSARSGNLEFSWESAQIKSAPDPKNHRTLEQPSPRTAHTRKGTQLEGDIPRLRDWMARTSHLPNLGL